MTTGEQLGRAFRTMTTAQVAASLGVHSNTVHAYAQQGLIRRTRLEGERPWRYSPSDVEALRQTLAEAIPTPDAAALLGVHRGTLDAWAAAGRVQRFRPHARAQWLYSRRQLVELLHRTAARCA